MTIIDKWKEKQLKKIIEKTGNNITGIKDFTAGENPSLLFYLLGDKFNYLLDNNPQTAISKTGVILRRPLPFERHLTAMAGTSCPGPLPPAFGGM